MRARAALSPAEVDAGYELASRVFGPTPEAATAMHERIRSLEPLRSLEDVIVLADGPRVLGFARILDRSLNTPGGVLAAGGITSVCIDPTIRAQGWGLRVMEAAIERSQRRGDICSILFARRAVDGWYPRLGYVGIGAHVSLRVLGTERGGIAESAVGEVPDLAQVDRLAGAYRSSYGGLFLSFDRPLEWWACLPEQLALKRSLEFLAVRSGGDVAGYCIRSGGVIVEAAAIQGSEEAVRDFALSHGALALPTGHWLMRAAQGLDHELTVRYSWSGGHMVRVLERDAFLSGLGTIHTPDVELDVTDHGQARALLLWLAGADGGAPRWPDPPAWSLVDEL